MERLPAHEVPQQVLPGAPAVEAVVLPSLRFRPLSSGAAVHCCSSAPSEIALVDAEYAVHCAEGVEEVQVEWRMLSDHSDQSVVQHYRQRQQMPAMEVVEAVVEWPSSQRSPAAVPFEGSMFGLREILSRHLPSV